MKRIEMTAADHEKAHAAGSSVLAAIFLTAMKVVVGWMSGSLGILAEAAHSGLDLAAALITLMAVRLSSKPADQQHHYGHGKIENLSALFETLLLLVTSVWIIREAVHRLIHPTPVEASIWAFLVVVISIVVDVSRSRMLMAAAKKHNSPALAADALHFSTDIWSSCVVLAGLAGVKLAEFFPALGFLKETDSVAGLVVAALVIWVSVRMGVRTVSELLDTAPHDVSDRVKAIAESIENVKDCHAVRVRPSGNEIFIDAHVLLEGHLTLTEAHRVTDLIEEAIRKEIPGADITVHAEPLEPPPKPESAS